MLERIHQLVKRSSTPPDSVIQLLKGTLIGTNGSLYQLMDTEKKIYQLHQAEHLYLERHEKAIGNVTICRRKIGLNQQEFDSLYLRYFAFDSIFQASGEKHYLKRSGSAFQNYLLALFKTSNFNPALPEHKKSMYWAFIDPQNSRSFNMNERLGFQTIGSFTTTAFSRVNPKNKTSVSRITEEEKAATRHLVNSFYGNFNFFSTVHLFDNDDFFILKVNQEIVAGIQANPVQWKIKSLPGKSGKFLVSHAQKIPRVKKLINPENHEFLATEGLFWKPGFEDKIEELLEGVLNLTDKHSLLIWTDSQNHMLEKLPIRWGFIQKMKTNNSIDIVAKFNDFEKIEIDKIKKEKKYLSGFDMT